MTENNYNLSISTYVEAEDTREKIDIVKLNAEIEEIVAREQVHGQTAAEVIYDRADSEKEHMGLTTWDGAPKSKIHVYDVIVAKNYLSGSHLISYITLTHLFGTLILFFILK